MKLLELYSGTESFSKIAKLYGFEAFTIENNPNFKPSLVKNILELKKADIPFIPDIIWASPPCTEYSIAKRDKRPRNFELADSLVKKAFEIFSWFPNSIWFLENPQSGLLKSREFMKNINFKDTSYCKYNLPYRKNTRIWTNFNELILQPKCKRDCNFMIGKRHQCSAGNARYNNSNFTPIEKSAIPPKLCEDIIKQLLNLIR